MAQNWELPVERPVTGTCIEAEPFALQVLDDAPGCRESLRASHLEDTCRNEENGREKVTLQAVTQEKSPMLARIRQPPTKTSK